MEAHSVSYALASLKGKIVMVDISKDDLLKQFESKSDSLETGKYFIYECLHFNNDLINVIKLVALIVFSFIFINLIF